QIIDLATNHRRWGYRKVCDVINAMRDKSDTYLPRVNHKRIERIWREEGLKVPKESTRRRELFYFSILCVTESVYIVFTSPPKL
ncbi:MAG: transposase, partial [Clostridia bacterium]|nr:transposase [Clostridia bacterium]